MRNLVQITAGLVAGMALVVACAHLRPAPAAADPAATSTSSPCAQWQVTSFAPDIDVKSSGALFADASIFDVPAGWQPIGFAYNGTLRNVMLTRCKP